MLLADAVAACRGVDAVITWTAAGYHVRIADLDGPTDVRPGAMVVFAAAFRP